MPFLIQVRKILKFHYCLPFSQDNLARFLQLLMNKNRSKNIV
ncbi:hypothetical protein CHCC14820_1100 [Bacillus paralicheniformis]|nr:hypothetical protein CHCC14820_1100 [Bacillus paralicheniformis]